MTKEQLTDILARLTPEQKIAIGHCLWMRETWTSVDEFVTTTLAEDDAALASFETIYPGN